MFSYNRILFLIDHLIWAILIVVFIFFIFQSEHFLTERNISNILALLGFFCNFEKSKTAKSVCIPSSLEINSLENDKPGIRPLFFNQNIEQKDPEKKIPSTAAKATNLSA